MKNTQRLHADEGSAMSHGADGTFTRRELMGGCVLGAASLGAGASPLRAEDDSESDGKERRIIDSHVHLWKLPRNAPPMSDNATFPTGCCGSVPWMEVDRMPPDYDARVGGPKVDKLVLIESSVGVPADKIIQSNLWMLQTAAAFEKILSVVGNLDVTQSPGGFALQLGSLAMNKQFVGIRIGGGIFLPGMTKPSSNLKPNVITNLTLMANQGLEIDTLGIPGAALSQI